MTRSIPSDFIDDLISRIDIVDVIDPRLPLKKSGRNYVARCPFHNEKTPSFSVSREKQFYYCFGCGASGTAIGFLMDFDHLNFVEAVEDLAAYAGLEIPKGPTPSANTAQQTSIKDLYDIQNRIAALYASQLRKQPQALQAVEYLKSRGISGEIARLFNLGYAFSRGSHLGKIFDKRLLIESGLLIEKENGRSYDRFRDRIIFPIKDKRGRVVGFGGRVLDQSMPKYLNSPETPTFHKGKEVYGLYELLKAVRKPLKIVVVEGYMDVLALVQNDIPYVVATLGTATSLDHIKLLFRFTSELVFCFDGDQAGKKAAWKAVEAALPEMRDGRQIRVIFLPEGSDPDTMIRDKGADAFLQQMNQSKLLSDYFFNRLADGVKLDEMEGRASLINRARPLIDKMPSSVFKDMMESRLAELAGLNSVNKYDKYFGSSHSKNRPDTFRKDKSKPSPVKTAITLLLKNPGLAQIVDKKSMRDLDIESPGLKLLKSLLELLIEKPGISLGQIVEKFRGSAEEKYIKVLSQWQTLIPAEGVDKEFSGALARIKEKQKRDRVSQLISEVKEDPGNKRKINELSESLKASDD